MHLTLPFPEALELALQGAPPPPPVRGVSCTGARVRVDVDLRDVPAAPFAVRAIAAITPVVTVDATFAGFREGRATFELAVHAGSLPVHRLINHLTGLINSTLRARDIPPGLLLVQSGPDGDPVAVVDLQAAADLRVQGVTVAGFVLHDATIEVEAAVRDVRLRRAAATPVPPPPPPVG
ncbi:hypothetical protein [Cellulomonas fimi]|uniref:Uncharacterized protein n=1 Tax=Cellulomonas fimi TaxID=1708 RepID=A0A7Y0LYU8_CELFI|nr:hypothetical protein [Cellulomonas fimi]NMR19918.1 hypothetical protein [Cellulomonas fimi]